MTSMTETSLVAFSPVDQVSDREILASVQSTITLIRLGQPFLLKADNAYHFCLAVDGMTSEAMISFAHAHLGRSALLVLTAERGDALGFDKDMPISMPMTAGDTPESLAAVAASHPAKINRRPILEQSEARPALELLAHAQMLPACLFVSNIQNVPSLINNGVPVVETEAIERFEAAKVASLERKSEAPIPVRGGINTRMVVFQYATGENEVALIVGKPDLSRELPIRIHSACATGDIFGSERCDCGDQLRLAIEKLDEMGGGAVLYLAQEGRGIGLVNKIRAYDLQDQSLDTVDANHALGFADDRRNFSVAAAMIRALGWKDVAVLTNNPRKVDALEAHGISVTTRIAHQAPINENNNQYLRTKAKRSGHLLKY